MNEGLCWTSTHEHDDLCGGKTQSQRRDLGPGGAYIVFFVHGALSIRKGQERSGQSARKGDARVAISSRKGVIT